MSASSQRAIQKMRAGTVGGQARVAQPLAFPRPRLQKKKKRASRGLRAWYDASDTSTYDIDGGGRVMNCLDKSGTQRHLIAPTNAWFNTTQLAVDACRPALLVAAQNGLNCFNFARSSSVAADILYRRDKEAFNFLHRGPATVFLVTKPMNLNSGNRFNYIATTYFNSGTWLNGDTGYELRVLPNEFFVGQDYFQATVINNQQGGNEQSATTAFSSGTPPPPFFSHSPPVFHIITVLTNPTLPNSPNPNPDRARLYLDNNPNPAYNFSSGGTTGIDSAGYFGINGCIAGTYSGAIPPADTTPTGQGLQVFGEARIYEGLLPDYDWMSIRDELNDKWAVY